MGSWARLERRRPAVTSKLTRSVSTCPCVISQASIQESAVLKQCVWMCLLCVSPWPYPTQSLSTGLIHLPWIQSRPSLGWRLLSNFMSWLHLDSFSGVVHQPHPVTDNLCEQFFNSVYPFGLMKDRLTKSAWVTTALFEK